MKKILYAQTYSEMNVYYNKFKKDFYNYLQPKKHFELIWEC